MIFSLVIYLLFLHGFSSFLFQNYKATEETSLTIIDEPEQLNDLLQKLKIVKEFAVDLEVICDI